MKKSFIFKMLAVMLAAVMGVCVLSACSGDEENTDTNTTVADEVQTTQTDIPVETDPNAEHTKVKFEIEIAGEDAGSFTMVLYPEYAPITVENFIKLVNEKFYDGVKFHRILDGFMAQGGMNTEKKASSIKGEFALNGVKNDLKHDRGIVSMARTDVYDSASSQFFICYNRDGCAHLDGQYAAFGKVIEGMEVVDSFLEVQRSAAGMPKKDIVITSAYIVK